VIVNALIVVLRPRPGIEIDRVEARAVAPPDLAGRRIVRAGPAQAARRSGRARGPLLRVEVERPRRPRPAGAGHGAADSEEAVGVGEIGEAVVRRPGIGRPVGVLLTVQAGFGRRVGQPLPRQGLRAEGVELVAEVVAVATAPEHEPVSFSVECRAAPRTDHRMGTGRALHPRELFGIGEHAGHRGAGDGQPAPRPQRQGHGRRARSRHGEVAGDDVHRGAVREPRQPHLALFDVEARRSGLDRQPEPGADDGRLALRGPDHHRPALALLRNVRRERAALEDQRLVGAELTEGRARRQLDAGSVVVPKHQPAAVRVHVLSRIEPRPGGHRGSDPSLDELDARKVGAAEQGIGRGGDQARGGRCGNPEPAARPGGPQHFPQIPLQLRRREQVASRRRIGLELGAQPGPLLLGRLAGQVLADQLVIHGAPSKASASCSPGARGGGG
jgi:hypothetical protein